MRGFQLWVNLPANDKMCAPRYQNLKPEEIPEVLNLAQAREEVERREIPRALSRAEGNISQAAKLLGVSRPTLYDLMRQHGFRVD